MPLQTVSNISNYTVNNNVNWTSPPKQITITDFTNPSFPRNIFVSGNGIQVSRPGNAVGIAIPDLLTLVVAVNPALTWPPRFTMMPANTTAQYGGATSFTTTVSSELTPSYQWQKSADSGVTWTNATGGVYSGDTTATLSISDASGLNNYQFRVVATNSQGSNTSSIAVLTVVDPGITIQPASHTVTHPAATTFTVTAHGASSLSYNWQVSTDGGVTWVNASGGVYSGNTIATLSISDSTGLNGNKYRVAVTDTAGTQVSSVATLTVL